MTQLNFTEQARVDTGSDGTRGADLRRSPAAHGSRPVRRSVDAKRERIRQEAEDAARRRFPKATLVRCNPAHQGGPVVEVRCPGWPATRLFAFTGYEL